MFSHASTPEYPLSSTPRPYLGQEAYYKATIVGSTEDETVFRERAHILEEDFYKALEDVGQTLRTIKDPTTDMEFEVAVANLNAEETSYDAEVSTYNSSLTTNPANALEFAEHAALEPGKRRIYIASLGNGFSAYLNSGERSYFRKTGSMLGPDGAVEPVKALARALRTQGIRIDRLSANSGGGNLATALAVHLPEGDLTHAYLKSRPNIINHHPLALAGRMLIGENLIANRQNRRISKDDWSLTKALNEDTRPFLDSLKERGAVMKEQSATLGPGMSALKLINDAIAYSRAGDKGPTWSPAMRDTEQLLERQEEALLTFHISEQDSLYRGRIGEVARFIRSLHLATIGRVEGLFIPGSHADHTYTPSVRWTFERYAFERI